MLRWNIHFPFYQFLPLPFHFFNIGQLLFIIILVMLFICNAIKNEHFKIVFKSISLSNVGKKRTLVLKKMGEKAYYFPFVRVKSSPV